MRNISRIVFIAGYIEITLQSYYIFLTYQNKTSILLQKMKYDIKWLKKELLFTKHEIASVQGIRYSLNTSFRILGKPPSLTASKESEQIMRILTYNFGYK